MAAHAHSYQHHGAWSPLSQRVSISILGFFGGTLLRFKGTPKGQPSFWACLCFDTFFFGTPPCKRLAFRAVLVRGDEVGFLPVPWFIWRRHRVLLHAAQKGKGLKTQCLGNIL